ncbi:MAG: hypothetical protein WBW73_16685, partial [Rhodoplanes sp.]
MADVEKVLGGELADMTFTDPPYNVNYANSVDHRRGRKNRPIKNDALGDAFGGLLYHACINILTVTKGAVYMCMSSSELDTLQKAFREAGGKWSTFVIWATRSRSGGPIISADTNRSSTAGSERYPFRPSQGQILLFQLVQNPRHLSGGWFRSLKSDSGR